MAINPMMFPAFMGMGGQQPQQMQQPMAPQMQPQAPQTPDSLAEFTRLLSGDLSGSLTSGDKLLALSGLLRSATRSGRRAGLTPEQVIGGLQQRKVAEVQNRLALQGMQQKARQEEEARAAAEKYRARLRELTQAGEPMSPNLLNKLGQEAIAGGDVDLGLKFFEQAAKMAPGEVKPKPTRERFEGATIVQEEFDPATKKWTVIGRGPRFGPRSAGVTVNVGERPGAAVVPYTTPDGQPGFLVRD